MYIEVTKKSMDEAVKYLAELYNTNSYESTYDADEIAIELATGYSIVDIRDENYGVINNVASDITDCEDYIAWNSHYYNYMDGFEELLDDIKTDAQNMSNEMDIAKMKKAV